MSPAHQPARFQGVLSPVVTPFDADLRPDGPRFVRHCRWLLSQDVGLAVFGTNSEGNSLSTGEKIRLLDTLADVYEVDEVVVVTITEDEASRRRSYELLAEAFALPRAPSSPVVDR